MSFKPEYGSLTSSLWTPAQSGAFGLSTGSIASWIDAEHTASVVSASGDGTYNAGYEVVVTLADRFNGKTFGQVSADGRTHARYAAADLSASINSRRTVWFSEQTLSSPTYDVVLTASTGDWQSLLPAGNEDRAVFAVYKINRSYPYNQSHFVYSFGDNAADQEYSQVFWVTGSTPQEKPGYIYLTKGGSPYYLSYVSGSSFLFNESETPEVWYQYHSSSGVGAVTKNGSEIQTEWSYSGATLATHDSTSTKFTLGDDLALSKHGFGWTLGELIVLKGVPTTSDRQRIEGYLSHKWGTTGSLPASHPYKSTAPTNSDGELSFTFENAKISPPNTGRYFVNREGGAGAITASINVSPFQTAVRGIDYDGAGIPATLTWDAGETGSQFFDINFLENPAHTGTLFIPYISSSGLAGLSSPSSSFTNIIYPGKLNFDSENSTIIEKGGTSLIQITRTSGTYGELTASLVLTGTADPTSDFTLSGITFANIGGTYRATASMASGVDGYTFSITGSDDLGDEADETAIFQLSALTYPLSASLFFPTATIGETDEHTVTILDLETGSLNFSPFVVGPSYVTGTQTITYNVIRSIGGDGNATADIHLSSSTTAIAGIDYTDPGFPITLSWGDGDTGSEPFSVTFKNNAAFTSTLFVPYIRSSVSSSIGTASFATTNVVHPGKLNFASTGSTVVEGGTVVINIPRTNGMFGDITGTLSYAGSAGGSDYTAPSTFTIADGIDGASFNIVTSDDAADEGNETIVTSITSLEYPLSGSAFFPTASIGTTIATNTITIIDNESGSVRINNLDGYNIYTASMPVTWSIERYGAFDGIATATIDLAASGGYSSGVYGLDYTGSSGSFPYSFTWADQESGTQTFSILTVANGAMTGTSISPAIVSTSSSFGTMLGTGSNTSSAAWITHPGYAYLTDSTPASQITEGGNYELYYRRETTTLPGLAGGLVGELTATLSFSGTAISGTDYTFPEASPPKPTLLNRVSYADANNGTSFTIQTTDDSGDEDNETIVVYLNSVSGTIYKFPTTGKMWTDGFAFNTGSLIDPNATYQTSSVTIIDNESGSVNFSTVSSSFSQPNSTIITVGRAGGGDFAATATIDQTAGTATKGTDYSGLPVTLNWNDQEQGNKTFTITGINSWGSDGLTVVMGFTSLTNIETGSTTPQAEITITNTVTSEGSDEYPLISPDGTINNYRNAFTSRRNKGAVPFSYGLKSAFSIRKRNSASSGSLGGKKNG